MPTIQIDGLLTKDDRATLEELIRWYRNVQRDKIQRPIPRVEVPDSDTTEVYIARTIEDGIPALTPEPGDGPTPKDRPGEAICELYTILRKSTNYELWPIPQLKQRVFNLTAEDIPANEWVPIMRDKFGRWLAVRGGSGVAETGFWGRVIATNCTSGSFTIREQEIRPYGLFTDKENGIESDQTFHVDKGHGAWIEGPLLEVGTICWVRRGWLHGGSPPIQEYIIDCPAGYTGWKRVLVDVMCQDGSLAKLLWYYHWRNGQLIKEPCVGWMIGVCGPCTTHPFTPGFGSLAFRAALALAALGASVGALL